MGTLAKRFGYASALVAIVLVMTPVPAHAASATFFGPIVPAECHCDDQPNPDGGPPLQTAPDFGCVLQTIQNAINFAISFSIILFTLYAAYAGFRLMTSGGNTEALSEGKTRIMNVLIGVAVVLTAWLLVDFVMKTFYEPSTNEDGVAFGPWNAILQDSSNEGGGSFCIVAKSPQGISTGDVTILLGNGTVTGGGSGATGGGGGGDKCSPIADAQLTDIGGGYKLVPDAAKRFLSMKAAAKEAGVTLTVSSAYRSPEDQVAAWNKNGCSVVAGKAVCKTRTAAIPCSLGGNGSNHSRGTAVDIKLVGNTYTWLRANASKYGFYNNLPNDLPHWSDTGR